MAKGQTVSTEGRILKHGTVNCYQRYGCRCDECKLALRLKNLGRKRNKHRLSLEPLINSIPGFQETHKNGIERWVKAGGISVFEADKLCAKHNIHPLSVYGSEWYSDYWAL